MLLAGWDAELGLLRVLRLLRLLVLDCLLQLLEVELGLAGVRGHHERRHALVHLGCKLVVHCFGARKVGKLSATHTSVCTGLSTAEYLKRWKDPKTTQPTPLPSPHLD